MQQFVVQKTNRAGEQVWTTRVLTVDPVHRILYLSKRRGASELDHHCMLTIKKVSVWPMYSWFFHPTSFFIGDSERTLCIHGSTVTQGESSLVNRLFHLRTRKATAAEQSALEASQQQRCESDGSTGSDAFQMPDEVYRDDFWVLRCMTDADLVAVVDALRKAVGNDARVKMWTPRNSTG